MSELDTIRTALRTEIDRRRRALLGIPVPLMRKTLARDEIVEQAQQADMGRFARLRLACFEGSPVDLDLHAAEVVLTLHKKNIEGPAALTVGAGAAGPKEG